MPARPKRKKRSGGRAESLQSVGRPSDELRLGAPSDLGLRTLIVLSVGEWWELADHEKPPARIAHWLEKADVRDLRGALLAVLARWRELGQS
jgi:hypothetical protein